MSDTDGSPNANCKFTQIIPLTATQYLELYTYQSTGSDKTMDHEMSYLNIHRLS